MTIGRLPIRVRLTLLFALAMAIVLAAVAGFLYTGLRSALDQTIDGNLETRANDVAALVKSGSALSSTPNASSSTGSLADDTTGQQLDPDDFFAQVLLPSGEIVDSTATLTRVPLLSASELAAATARSFTVDRAVVPGVDASSRLRASAMQVQGRDLIVVVGASLEARSEALSNLLTGLAIGGPLALIVASLLAWVLASAAFRPIESMRKQAEAISALEPGRRLPVPAARDEVARLAVTLNEMLARLESAFVKERAFVANASHELRTPLTLLKGELDVTLSRERTREELMAALCSSSASTDSLVGLAEDLLVLARADQGRLPINRTRIDARDLLESAKERFVRRASEAGTTIEVDAPAELRFDVDRLRFDQALTNLVENALRHGAGPIVLRAARDGDQIALHVVDNGPGFSESFLPHAFERFSRADESRSKEGTGLGLPIVGIIAQAHGGGAHIANRDGGGVDVCLTIPSERPN